MLFSSLPFLYYFLPAVLILYFLTPAPGGFPKYRNYMLLLASLLFYFWGGPGYFVLLLAQSFLGWGFGLLIEWRRGKRGFKLMLVLALILGLGGLVFYKYTDFFIGNFNAVFGASVPLLRLVLPIGISFYTFQVLSYDIDLYRGKAAVQRNPFTFLTYVALFPPLIAGPIIRYTDIEKALYRRPHSFERFGSGARRFVIGLGKKVLIANVLGELVAVMRDSPERSVLGVWLYLVAYALQIYFDFSGYSDMALGLSRIFGFDFLENFNYPYISKSVTEFWRRWHISLSSWFRDYVYIPLGGNRVKKARWVLNIMVVWFLTGFWHGADWSFIAWGLYFGLLLLVEKLFLGKVLLKTPAAVQHIWTMLLVLIGWAFFDAATFGEAVNRLGLMVGAGASSFAGPVALYYLRSYALPLLLGVLGSTPLPKRAAAFLLEKGRGLMTVLEPLGVGVLLLTVTAFLVDGSFNPFIYFRF